MFSNRDSELDGTAAHWPKPFCYACFRTAPFYLMLLSLFAVAVIISDNVEMFKRCGLPACDWRCLVPDTNTDLLRSARKVMGGLALLMYIILFFGVLLRSPALLMPYLVIQGINIFLSCVLLVLALATRRCALNKSMFFQFIFMVVNWLLCYCYYQSMYPTNVKTG